MFRRFWLFLSLAFPSFLLIGQDMVVQDKINWDQIEQEDWSTSDISGNLQSVLSRSQEVDRPPFELLLHVMEAEVISTEDIPDHIVSTNAEFELDYRYSYERGNAILMWDFTPFRQMGNGLAERIVKYALVTDPSRPDLTTLQRDPPVFAENSVMRDGDLYKIAVTQSGMYRLEISDLEELGINTQNLNPDRINIYGNGFGAMPQGLSTSRPDDLRPVAIDIVGDEDGSLDPGDYILFYARDQHRWYWDDQEEMFLRRTNIYAEESYYFIKVETSSSSAVRIAPESSDISPIGTINEYTDRRTREDELFNIMNENQITHGSGQDWFGDWFRGVREVDYSSHFRFPNAIEGRQGKVLMRFVGRSSQSSRVFLDLGGNTYERSISGVDLNTSTGSIFSSATLRSDFGLDQDQINTVVRYPDVPASELTEGWLDYITMNVPSELRMNGSEMRFDIKTPDQNGVYTIHLEDAADDIQVWDITLDLERNHSSMVTRSEDGGLQFESLLETPREYVAFLPEGVQRKPRLFGGVANQNLHSIQETDVLLVFHSQFEVEAMRWKEHRENESGLDITAVEVSQVYNEFSSGMQDPTAIRDMARMLYERSERFKYLVLFGSASFDQRGIDNDLPAQNFIPTYETVNSFNALNSHPSDDYFALLDDEEGDNLRGGLDIAVGRFPARTVEEARVLVDKLISFETSEASKGDWRLRVGLISDDEDGNAHFRQSENMAEILEDQHPYLNLQKVHFDAYPQQSTPGGERYPAAQNDLNNGINNGWVVTNFIGHGGPVGWADERVLTNSDIFGWTNFTRPTIMLTATCTFMPFDDANITSSGENVLFAPNGGAVALLSTVRIVLSNSNAALTRATFERIFKLDEDGNPVRIGEAVRQAKNLLNGGQQSNSRKYLLFGDPTMPMPVPSLDVTTDMINGLTMEEWQDPDDPQVIGSLEEVTISGSIRDIEGDLVSEYNGIVAVTIFDKEKTITTLANDERSSEADFNIRRNIVYKGLVSAVNGEFEYSFVVPLDIDLDLGEAKISYYASSEVSPDAKGADFVLLGGTAEELIEDDNPPTVDLYLNNLEFVSGDKVANNPLLIALLEDDLGINVTGNSIGHDLTAVIDENTGQAIVLNDFFEPEVDNSAKGEVRYNLGLLEDGLHTLTVKAWDIANNSNDATIEFVIASDFGLSLERLFAHPNPVVDFTNFGFQHNLRDGVLDIVVSIYDMQGRKIDDLRTTAISEDGVVQGIRWDAADAPSLTQGMYIYNIRAEMTNPATGDRISADAADKLIIIR